MRVEEVNSEKKRGWRGKKRKEKESTKAATSSRLTQSRVGAVLGFPSVAKQIVSVGVRLT
jgi:hypothetical protein